MLVEWEYELLLFKDNIILLILMKSSWAQKYYLTYDKEFTALWELLVIGNITATMVVSSTF